MSFRIDDKDLMKMIEDNYRKTQEEKKKELESRSKN